MCSQLKEPNDVAYDEEARKWASCSPGVLVLAWAALARDDNARAEVPFAAPKDISNGSVSGVTSLVAGDLNGDGRADVVVIEGGKHAGGRKTFAWFEVPSQDDSDWPRHDFETDVKLRPFLGAARLADMDGDGDLDVVTGIPWSNKSVSQSIMIYYNDGAGRFSQRQTVIRDKGMYTGVVIDFDGDGDLDLVGQDSYSRESKPWLYENLLRK